MNDTRPALAAVLSALTDTTITRPVTIAWARGVHHIPQTDDERVCVLAPWRTIDGARDLRTGTETAAPRLLTPIDSLEILTERGLWPWQPGDPTVPRWFCEACGGTGWGGEGGAGVGMCLVCLPGGVMRRNGPRGDGTTDDPPSLSALVAVASLGAERLRTVAEVVAELRRVTRATCSTCKGTGWVHRNEVTGTERCWPCKGVGTVATLGDRVVWRVLPREALCEHHEERARKTCAERVAWLCATFSACVNAAQWIDGVDPYGTDHRPLRALHDCGVHLLDADARRVVIGVEAL